MNAIYRVDGNRVETSANAAGPWDPGMQHGSAPAALVTWAAEAIPTSVPMQIVRLTIDLMRPVPVAPLTIESEVLRGGRKIQLCAVRLLANNVLVVRATVLKVRADSLPLPSEIVDAPIDVAEATVEPGTEITTPALKAGFDAPGCMSSAPEGETSQRLKPVPVMGRICKTDCVPDVAIARSINPTTSVDGCRDVAP